jgi:hypothetical protein
VETAIATAIMLSGMVVALGIMIAATRVPFRRLAVFIIASTYIVTQTLVALYWLVTHG